MLKKTFFLIVFFVLLCSIVVAQEIPVRKTANGLEYQGCLVQLKEKPVLGVTGEEEKLLKDFKFDQSVIEEQLRVLIPLKADYERELQKVGWVVDPDADDEGDIGCKLKRLRGRHGNELTSLVAGSGESSVSIIAGSDEEREIRRLRNNFRHSCKEIRKLTRGVARLVLEKNRAIAKEKEEVDDQLRLIVNEQQNFVNTLEDMNLDELIKDKLFLGFNGFVLDVDEQKCNDLKSLNQVSGTVLNYIEHTALSESLPLMCDNNAQTTDNSCSVWGLNDADGQSLKGTGIKVAVIDTGIDYGHADFGSCDLDKINDNNPATCPKIFGGWDFLNNDNNPIDRDPCTPAEISDGVCPDQNARYGGHGTHVASTIAGNGALKGVAPDAKLIIFKTLGGFKGGGSTVGRIKAIGCATGVLSNVADIVVKHAGLANAPTMTEINKCSALGKADVMSLSLALRGTGPSPVYDPAKCDLSATTFSDGELLNCPIDRAVKNGVIAVVAAGNFGPNQGTIGNPGTSVKAITVGNSCDRAFSFQSNPLTSCAVDGLAPSSSRGPTTEGRMKPDVTAPGTFITAAWPSGVDRVKCDRAVAVTPDPFKGDTRYCTISGTSMATPHVSGVVALMLQKNKGLTPDEIKDILMRTAKNVGGIPFGTAGYGTDPANFNDGAGRVNARAAVDAVPSPAPPACTATGAETCNGLDDDCVGGIDNVVPATLSCGNGPCRVTNVVACVGGVTQICTPDATKSTAETGVKCSNTIDDDCDGWVDSADTVDCPAVVTDTTPPQLTLRITSPAATQRVESGVQINTVPAGTTQITFEMQSNEIASCNYGVKEIQRTGTDTSARLVLPAANTAGNFQISGEVLSSGATPAAQTLKDNQRYQVSATCADASNNERSIDLVFEIAAAAAAACTPTTPTTEVCDGRDNDCVGGIDNVVPATLSCGNGPCRVTNVVACVGGVAQTCTPDVSKSTAEVCDGVDNDCNGNIDNLPQLSCGTGACLNTVPACVGTASNTCTPNAASAEQCSGGRDEDCDGLVDSADDDCAVVRNVPDWASWAAKPVGVNVAPLTNGVFAGTGNIDVRISGYDFVWSKGYRSASSVLKAGPPYSAANIWLPFDVNAGSNPVEDRWIRVARTAVLSSSIPSASFVANTGRFNSVVLFACKFVRRTTDFFEYDCNGVDGKTVKIKPDKTRHQDSGRGSWLLRDFEKS